MRNPNIKFAQIKNKGKSSELDLTTSLSQINEIEKYRYLLIIKSETTRYAKFTVYS